ncbi:MAG: PAS domain-containing protein [Blastocatellia bacterium]
MSGESQNISAENAEIAELRAQVATLQEQLAARQTHETQLRQSEERFRLAADAAGALVYEVDLLSGESAIVYGLKRLTGYDPQEVTPNSEWWHTLLHPDDLPAHLAELQQQLQHGGTHISEYRVQRRDGAWRTVEDRRMVMHNGEEQAMRIIGAITDITARKEAEQERQRFVSLVENSSEFIATCDLNFQPTYANNAAYRLLGLRDREAARQIPFKDFFFPEDLTWLREVFLPRVLREGRAETELRLRNVRTGEPVWVLYNLFKVRDEQGKTMGLASVSKNITERKRQEEALRLSEERLRLAIEAAHLGTFDWHIHDNQSVWGGYHAELFGLPPDKIHVTYDEFLQLIHPEDRAEVDAAVQQSVAEDTDYAVDFRVRLPDGGVRWLHDQGRTLRDAAGQPERMIGIVQDISAQREAEEKLQLANYRFRVAEEAAQGFHYEWNLETGLITRSKSIVRVLGYQRKELPRNWEAWAELMHPDDRMVHSEAAARAFLHTLTEDWFGGEYRVRHKDGHYVWVLEKGLVIRNAHGQVTRVIGQTVNIHERKRAEERLRESEERLELAVAATQLGIWDVNLLTKEFYWSPRTREIHGLADDTPITAELVLSLIHPEDQQLWREATQSLLDPQNSGTLAFEHRFIKPNGTVRWAAVRGRADTAEINGERRVVRLTGSTLDITARKEAEAERERLLAEEQRLRGIAEAHNRAKDEFLAVVSHELRNPLNAILGYTRMARKEAADAAIVRQHCDIIERNARLQHQLIEDLLDTARIITGKLRIEAAPTDLRLVLAEALAVIEPAAVARQITLSHELGEHPNFVFGDAARLQQIAWNLLQNAIKFTPSGGRVTLRLEAEPAQVRLIVSDTGKGIEPGFLPAVFDRFVQNDMARNRRHGGLGLGLALVKQLVELHGGTITAASAGLDQGATFTVTLPRHAPRAVPTPPPVRAIAEVATGEEAMPLNDLPRLDGVRLLVVDDQDDARQLLANTLHAWGATVLTAASGVAVRACLAEQTVDALICDISMPEEDGYAVIRQLRASEQQRGVPLAQRLPAVALTALSRAEDRLAALSAGFQMHVAKPIELAELIIVISSLLRNQRQRAQE